MLLTMTHDLQKMKLCCHSESKRELNSEPKISGNPVKEILAYQKKNSTEKKNWSEPCSKTYTKMTDITFKLSSKQLSSSM